MVHLLTRRGIIPFSILAGYTVEPKNKLDYKKGIQILILNHENKLRTLKSVSHQYHFSHSKISEIYESFKIHLKLVHICFCFVTVHKN